LDDNGCGGKKSGATSASCREKVVSAPGSNEDCAAKTVRHQESAMLTIGFLVTDSEHWRERAESVRVTANSLNDVVTKARMLKIAEGYDVLRRQTEERRHAGW
jgi:hypothetical protein